MDSVMSHRRIFWVAIALGFVGGFSFVAVANGSSEPPRTAWSASAYSSSGTSAAG
jgi:hypothetical protein